MEAVELKDEGAPVKEKAVMNISAKAFILVMAILAAMIVAAGVCTFFIPQGSYVRDAAGNIIDGSFISGAVKGYPVWRWLTAPFEVFASADGLNIIMVSLFLIILSGTFTVMAKTDGIKVLVGTLVKRFEKKKNMLVCLVTLIFMLFGSFFGMFEELVALMPIIIILSLSLGFDTLTGMGMCMLAACFGFSAAILNPFSVGTALKLVGLPLTSGMWLRIVFFAVTFILMCTFLLLHIRKIKKHPEKSLTYQMDCYKKKTSCFDTQRKEGDKRIFITWTAFFGVLALCLILIATVPPLAKLSVPFLAVVFLLGGFTCGLTITKNFKKVGKWFLIGLLSMLPAVVMIACASSVKFIMEKGGILDTIMYNMIGFLADKPKYIAILLIFGVVLFFQMFIGSATAKAMLIIPIIAPVCASVGVSLNLAILAFVLADGFTNVLFPTNPVLLVGLSMAEVSYGKWFKFTILLQLIVLALSLAVLYLGVAINY